MAEPPRVHLQCPLTASHPSKWHQHVVMEPFSRTWVGVSLAIFPNCFLSHVIPSNSFLVKIIWEWLEQYDSLFTWIQPSQL